MNVLSKSELNVIVDTTKFGCNVNGGRRWGGKVLGGEKFYSDIRAYLNINNLTPGNR